MKKRTTFLIVLVALVLLSTSTSALSAPRYQVETGTISGGSYQLASAGPQTDNISAGGAYRLLGPAAPAQQDSGCCCTYLPCIQRNW